jgi:2-amino-4-hydroxy-6-hydroxymethyldihydropteridine diphosphokinase
MTSSTPVSAYIALGSNIEPRKHIVQALQRLSDYTSLKALSDFYTSPALDRPEQPDFINGVAQIETDCTPFELKYTVLRQIEAEAGRQRTEDKYAARPLDLDVLLYGSEQINEEALTIPDPDICRRPFLFIPLLDLAPLLQLPGMDRPLQELCPLQESTDLQKEVAFTKHLKERFLL